MSRVLLAGVVAMAMASVAAAESLPLTGANTRISFVGTKPEGKHNGGFKTLTGTATLDGTDPTTLKIEVEIDMNTLFADDPKLTAHLKSGDFFDVKKNPKSKFVSTKVEKSGDGYTVTGQLTMSGKTREVSFPATIAATADGLTLTSTFKIDRTQWGQTYGRGKINDEVTLSVAVTAKK